MKKYFLVVFIYLSVAQASLVENLQQCRGIELSAERLECYDRMPLQPKNKATVVKESERNIGNWIISDKKNIMDGSHNVSLMLKGNPIATEWGEKHPELILRCVNNTTDVMVAWPYFMGSKGQDGRIKFDDENPKTDQWWIPSTTGTTLFYAPHPVYGGDPKSLLQAMIKHQKVVIESTPYDRIPTQVIFNIKGLKNAIKPLRKACHW